MHVCMCYVYNSESEKFHKIPENEMAIDNKVDEKKNV